MPEGYISTPEFAKRYGVCVETVNRWIREKRIIGAIKVPHRNAYGFIYGIPESAVLIPKDVSETPTSGKDYTPEEMLSYISEHCSNRTYRQISRELGIPAVEVRRIYDHLHEAYGV